MPLVLTTDIEWASEDHIRSLFHMADILGVPLFPFVTHESEYLKKRGGAQGIHPNFLPGSTQGKTETEVMDYCFKLVPRAKAFRAHCFYDHTRLQWAMADRGINIDSNVLRYMEPHNPRPYRCIGGYMRWPVFWSDDVAMRRGEKRIDKRRLNTTLPLVIDIHPRNYSQPMVAELMEYARNRSMAFEDL